MSVCSFDPGGHERGGRVSSVSVCSFDPGGHESLGSFDPGGLEGGLCLCAALILVIMRGAVE